jgi:hypothetical protein
MSKSSTNGMLVGFCLFCLFLIIGLIIQLNTIDNRNNEISDLKKEITKLESEQTKELFLCSKVNSELVDYTLFVTNNFVSKIVNAKTFCSTCILASGVDLEEYITRTEDLTEFLNKNAELLNKNMR